MTFWIRESETIMYAIENKIEEKAPTAAALIDYSSTVNGNGWLTILNFSRSFSKNF